MRLFGSELPGSGSGRGEWLAQDDENGNLGLGFACDCVLNDLDSSPWAQ